MAEPIEIEVTKRLRRYAQNPTAPNRPQVERTAPVKESVAVEATIPDTTEIATDRELPTRIIFKIPQRGDFGL